MTAEPVTSPCQVLLRDAIEAEARRVMARKARLKQIPGTHADQDDCVAEVDCLLDRWLEVMADDGDRA